ncbi:MAG: efflux RND transporter periplasmic adaptor subunit [Desulfobulbaceae bacterium]|nr:efflux RND transporter periplasmic adaptor subunit [Desulfobulbaceae bacterium]HIJ80013.1 efflux RND transporter periplasmic adaptor subunit [Deltaproteobacteria bacterium]
MRVLQSLLIIISFCAASAFAQGPPPAKVVVAKITSREVAENRPFLGLLYYDRVSHVSTEVAGLIDSVKVGAGDRVSAGSPLVTLDTELLEQEIAISRARVAQLELRSRHAEKNYKRFAELFAQAGVSERDHDDALYLYQDALKEQQVAENGLATLMIKKRKSVITAPFAGVILAKQVDRGDWVQPGRELVSIGSSNDLFVRVPVAETILKFITIGEKVAVEINAFGRQTEGVIEDLDPIADPQTKNIFLKVKIPAMARVAENMSATVFVPTSSRRQLAIIPRDALVNFQGKDFVYTVKEDKAAMLPVNIVTFLGDQVAADNPHFEAGMAVVVEGNERLRPDQAVIIGGEK